MLKDEYYIKIAEAVSLKSKCLKKHYGAIIVNNDEIISTGYNGAASKENECKTCTKVVIDHRKDEATYLSCPAVHAEMNAMLGPSRQEMIGSTLYLAGQDMETGEFIAAKPCEICLRLIKNAGIDCVKNKNGILYIRNSDGKLISVG